MLVRAVGAARVGGCQRTFARDHGGMFTGINNTATTKKRLCPLCQLNSGWSSLTNGQLLVVPLMNESVRYQHTSSSSSSRSSNNGGNHTAGYISGGVGGTRSFQTWNPKAKRVMIDPNRPGSLVFAESEIAALGDLFYHFAQKKNNGGVDAEGSYLCLNGVRALLKSVGERRDEETVQRLFQAADLNNDGKLHLKEFLIGADKVLGKMPARIVLVVGGPGSGKGMLCDRLAAECGIVHLSSGSLLRDEVARGTPLGKECAEIMARGELVSSATITTLIRRRMTDHPGKRVLLDGFPRSLENAHDFMELCGKPELALHLECDDTILMERIMKRSREGKANGETREDDTIDTALKRLRTYHKYHRPTMEWLREQHVPIVNLDCSGTPDNVWHQLLAIGRLMRPAAAFKDEL